MSGCPVIVYRGLSGTSWLQMPTGLCLSRHLPDPLQPYKGCLNRRGKQMHLSIEARKHEAGRLLKGEEFKRNPPFIYLPKTAGRLTASISHQRRFKHKKHVNAPRTSLKHFTSILYIYSVKLCKIRIPWVQSGNI